MKIIKWTAGFIGEFFLAVTSTYLLILLVNLFLHLVEN